MERQYYKWFWRLVAWGLLLLTAEQVQGQTDNDLSLDYQTLQCVNDTSQISRTVTIGNLNIGDSRFANGTFRIDWGDGRVENWGNEMDRSHGYANYGTYTLILYWDSHDGTKKLQKKFPFTLKREPIAVFGIQSSGTCINMETVFQIYGYEKESAETKYYFSYKGQEFKKLNQQEVMAVGGVVMYAFPDRMCSELIELRVTNECIEKGLVTGENALTYKPLTILSKINAGFEIEPEPVCTEHPFLVKLDKSGVKSCGQNVQYRWNFEGLGGATGENPNVRPYDTPGEKEVTLIARVENYACANDTITKTIQVIEQAKAEFTIGEDTLCYKGASLTLRAANASTGEDITSCIWKVNGTIQSITPELTDFSYVVSAPGTYHVELTVSNSCSTESKDTVFVVRQDPHIAVFDLPDTVCMQELSLQSWQVDYQWNGNTPKAHWKIRLPAGGETTSHELYPTLALTSPGKYQITVELEGIGCGGTRLSAQAEIWVVDNTITGTIVPEKVPVNDTIYLCGGETLGFDNQVTGEHLQHHWVVRPVGEFASRLQVEFAEGYSATSPSPVFKFKGYGDCVIEDVVQVSHACSRKVFSFPVRVGKAPTISIFEFGSDTIVCKGSTLYLNNYVFCNWYNNEKRFTWQADPDNVVMDKTQLYPSVTFPQVGVYTLTLTLEETSCSDAATRSMATVQIRVRESDLQCEVNLEQEGQVLCENQRLQFNNTATDLEGSLSYHWEIQKEGGETKLSEVNRAILFEEFPEYGDYRVVGTVIGYCDIKSDTVYFTIHKNPQVTLRDTIMCPGNVDMKKFVTYEWYNNTDQTVQWDIAGPTDGYAGDLNTLYPQLELKKAGDYQITVSVPTAGCSEGTDKLEARQVYHVYDTTISGTIALAALEAGDDPADICEGETITFTNTTAAEESIDWAWSVEGGAEDGYHFEDGGKTSRAQIPQLTFLKYGDYRVKVQITAKCNEREMVFPVTVRGVPEISLAGRISKICANDGTVVDMADYLEYQDRKNSVITPTWTVLPATGFTFEPGFDETTDFPHLSFTGNAHYTIQLTASSKCAAGGEQEFTTEIDVIDSQLKAAFSVGKDSIGCVDDDAEQFVVDLVNRSEGDSLLYTWTIRQVGGIAGEGWTWLEGDDEAKQGRIRITEQGFYQVRLGIRNICGRDDSVFKIRAFARPVVEIADIAQQCEPYEFLGRDHLLITENNDAIQKVEWDFQRDIAITPADTAYLHGTSAASVYPDIQFRAGDYTVTARYWNRCRVPYEKTFTVNIDKFIPITPLADQEICEEAQPVLLSAAPAGGTWIFKEGQDIAEPDRILFAGESGDYYFRPAFGAYEQKAVELVYRKDNGSCIARDTLLMQVWPLPHVGAGYDPEMCINHAPQLLIGKEKVGEDWEENGGHWELNGTVLPGHLFTAVTAGDFQVKYYYTDLHHCTNSDSAMMTVHPLPLTDFALEPMNCVQRMVEVRPVQLEGNRFTWDFGDGSAPEISQGDTVHLYTRAGFRTVAVEVVSAHGCIDSRTKETEILNLPPRAFFDVDTLDGCHTIEVNFSVDTSVYADNHNHLEFFWNYGEGSVSTALLPENPKRYEPGIWDTTYVARFTVSNMCDTLTYDTTLHVYSSPRVQFALMHDWECSPVWLELQNTTTGDGARTEWYFVNQRTGDTVYTSQKWNPEFEFTTDSVSTTYYITLKAINKCDEDMYTDSLVVKPRTISAHFTPLEHDYACVNQPIQFRNNSTDTLASILNTYWNFGDGSRDSVWLPVHAYDAAGTYFVSLKIDNGCGWDTVSAPVTIFPLPRLEIQVDDQLCEADTFKFVLKSDQELSRIDWDFGDGTRGDKDSLWHVYEGYGEYVVRVVGVSAEINHCTDSVRKTVEIYNKPIVTISPLDTIQCSPLYYKPEVTGEGFFMWDYGDGSEWDSSGEHQYENTSDTVQKFTVTAYVETDKGCKSEYQRQVTVYNLPRAALEKEVEQGKPEKVTFLNLSEEYTACIWILPFRGEVHSAADQTLEFDANGTYPVKLVAVNYFQCRDTAFLEHVVEMKGLYFPNSFIPHSKNGKVNRFNGIGIGLRQYKLEIFDLYGNKVWETRALEEGMPSEGWDGCNSKGKAMPQGTYVWRAEAIFTDDNIWTGRNNDSGNTQTTQGMVLLLRE